jgi:hypothetical protein
LQDGEGEGEGEGESIAKKRTYSFLPHELLSLNSSKTCTCVTFMYSGLWTRLI